MESVILRDAHRIAALAAAVIMTAACGASIDPVGPASPAEPAHGAVLKTLQVAPWRVECTGVAAMMCLQVRESAEAPWSNLHGEIVGFDHEAGFLYEVVIKEEAVASPPADGSSIRRTLVSIVRRTPAPPSIAGPTWRLVTLDGRAVLPGARVTAVFEGGARVAGSAGCNRYFGGASVAAETLTVGGLASTRMYCDADGVMPQEAAYLEALEGARAYRIAGGRLHLGPRPGTDTLVFEAELGS